MLSVHTVGPLAAHGERALAAEAVGDSPFAGEPATVEPLAPGLSAICWEPADLPGKTIALVPGWGAHPRYYGAFIRECLAAGIAVVSSWPDATGDVTTALHYQHLHELVALARRRSPAGTVIVVAESLGATYLLAESVLTTIDRAVLLAPGLLLRWRQLISRQAVRDQFLLLTTDRLFLNGWRLDCVSSDPIFLRSVRTSDLAPAFSDRRYVRQALSASLRAALAPRPAGYTWIVQSVDDPLLSPRGAKFLAARLGRERCRLTLVPRAHHGLLWDPEGSAALIKQIIHFCTAASASSFVPQI
jgi:alpha-beta hydrolase superfamily lysophospholipase